MVVGSDHHLFTSMKKSKILILLCCFTTLNISCKNDKEQKKDLENESATNSNQVTLNIINQHSLELDSVTSSFTYDIQSVRYEGKNCIAIINQLVNRIQIYDFESGLMIKNIDYDLEGDNGVGQAPRAFYIQNKDSIYIYEMWSSVVSLLNQNSKVISRFDLAPNGKNTGYSSPKGSTQSPLKIIDGKIYMAGIILPWENFELNENQFIQVDLKSRNLNYIVKRPEKYNMHNWGNKLMFYMNYTYNPNSKEFIFGFNNDENIVVTDLNGNNRRTFPTNSKYFDKIDPYDDEFSYNWNQQKLEEYHYLTPRFWGIMYDKYRKVTYRVALRPNSKEDYQIGVRSMQLSIIILNSEYQKIGEFDFDNDKYDPSMTFVSEEGLHFLNLYEFRDNEDKMVFDIFGIKELQ